VSIAKPAAGLEGYARAVIGYDDFYVLLLLFIAEFVL